jgi:hypothetical protein
MTPVTPTDAERVALKRIASLRKGLAFSIFPSLMFILLATQLRNDVAAIALASSAVLVLLGLLLYASIGLRCPRCSHWIPMPTRRSKCTTCGLALETAAEDGSPLLRQE